MVQGAFRNVQPIGSDIEYVNRMYLKYTHAIYGHLLYYLKFLRLILRDNHLIIESVYLNQRTVTLVLAYSHARYNTIDIVCNVDLRAATCYRMSNTIYDSLL